MPWAKKSKPKDQSKASVSEEGDYYATSQQERSDELFQKGSEAFSEKDSSREDNFTRIGRKVRVGALVISAVLFAGYFIAASEDEEASPSSPGKTKVVADSPSKNQVYSETQSNAKPQPLPKNGAIRSVIQNRPAVLRVKTAGSDHYLVKLTRPGSRAAVVDLFIRAGHSAEVRVPLGTFEIKWATGKEWFGYNDLFGRASSLNLADELFTFEQTVTKTSSGTRTSTTVLEITLYGVPSGNLRTKRISPDQF
tara:strand:- start:27 stop:782 length:756 start_codon:yes stop_codon:yes gene_type:complete